MDYLEEYIYEVVSQKIDILGKWRSAIDAVGDCEKIIVWGTATTVEYLLKLTDLGKKRVTYVDRSKTTFQGHRVFKPTEINFAEYPYVLVGAHHYQQEIIDELTAKYRYKGVIINPHSSCDELPFWEIVLYHQDPGILRGGANAFVIHNSVLEVIIKILRIRDIIRSIDNNARIGVYGDEKHLDYLQKFTDLSQKNVCCLLNDSVLVPQSLYCVNSKTIQNMNLDVVILAKLKDLDKFLSEIQDKYNGKIINFYDPDSRREFYEYECDLSDPEVRQTVERDALFLAVNKYCDRISQTGSYYINYVVYNKYSDDFPNYNYGADWRYDDSVIIIQGPIEYTNDFTYHTILQYLKMFPGVSIVVSTWEDSIKESGFAKIKSIPGIHIIICEKLSDPGPGNVYLQMHTTYCGLKYAKDYLNIEYALKIRGDSRLYSCEALEFMKFFSDCGFDPKKAQGMKGKIVCNIKYNAKMPDYHKLENIIADYWNFGHIEDMLKFWDPTAIEDNAAYCYLYGNVINVESFLYTRYIYAYTTIHSPEETDLIPWEHFYGFLPEDAFDFMWNKYNYMSFGWRHFAAASNMIRMLVEERGLLSWVEWMKKMVEVERNKSLFENKEIY